MNLPRRVVLESPFGRRVDGSKCTPEEYAANQVYLYKCLRDSLSRGEAPFASHALYPLVLDDTSSAERRQGMEAGFSWGVVADAAVVYEDYGLTPGMIEGIRRHLGNDLEIIYRRILNDSR